MHPHTLKKWLIVPMLLGIPAILALTNIARAETFDAVDYSLSSEVVSKKDNVQHYNISSYTRSGLGANYNVKPGTNTLSHGSTICMTVFGGWWWTWEEST